MWMLPFDWGQCLLPLTVWKYLLFIAFFQSFSQYLSLYRFFRNKTSHSYYLTLTGLTCMVFMCFSHWVWHAWDILSMVAIHYLYLRVCHTKLSSCVLAIAREKMWACGRHSQGTNLQIPRHSNSSRHKNYYYYYSGNQHSASPSYRLDFQHVL